MGGCLESIDELLRNEIEIPSKDDFSNIVLILETFQGVPTHSYTHSVIRALGERGLLESIKGVLVGRPDTGYMDSTKSHL